MHLYFYFKVNYFAMKISRQLTRLIFKLFWLAILSLQNHTINIPGLLDRALARLIVWALSCTMDRTQSTTLSVLCRQVHAISISHWRSIWSPSISFVCIASLFHAVPTLSFLAIREACLPHFRRSLPTISCKVLFLFLYEIRTGWRPIVSFTRLTGLGHELFVEPSPYSAYHL